MEKNVTSNCCDALMCNVDAEGIGMCTDCGEWCEAVSACIYCLGEGVTETLSLSHDGEPDYHAQTCICKL